MLSRLIWAGLAAGVVIAACLVATVPRRKLVPVLAVAFVSPVLVYIALCVADMWAHPSSAGGVSTAVYGFMLISPLLAPPWTAAFLVGLALGLPVRMLIRACRPRRKGAAAAPPLLSTAASPGWPDARPTTGSPRKPWAAWRAALLILLGAAVSIAGATAVSVQLGLTDERRPEPLTALPDWKLPPR
jgi:hypothetical protein